MEFKKLERATVIRTAVRNPVGLPARWYSCPVPWPLVAVTCLSPALSTDSIVTLVSVKTVPRVTRTIRNNSNRLTDALTK